MHLKYLGLQRLLISLSQMYKQGDGIPIQCLLIQVLEY